MDFEIAHPRAGQLDAVRELISVSLILMQFMVHQQPDLLVVPFVGGDAVEDARRPIALDAFSHREHGIDGETVRGFHHRPGTRMQKAGPAAQSAANEPEAAAETIVRMVASASDWPGASRDLFPQGR